MKHYLDQALQIAQEATSKTELLARYARLLREVLAPESLMSIDATSDVRWSPLITHQLPQLPV